MTDDHTTADQPDGEGLMKSLGCIWSDDSQVWLYGHGMGWTSQIETELADELEALLRRHVLTAQIELLEQLDDCPLTLIYVGIGDRLTALRDELAELEGEK